MYETLSEDYDFFVNWPQRLAFEMPFIEQQLQTAGPYEQPARVLDAACGTGWHVIELARRGYHAAGADLSPAMIARARMNAQRAGIPAAFETAGFGSLRGYFHDYDALLCLGNSLPHLLTIEDVTTALKDFAACLRPKGVLLIQNRNFDAVMSQRARWMGPESYQGESMERIFLRFYDFDPDGRITFHVITLSRQGAGAWQQRVDSTRLYPLLQEDLAQALAEAGFEQRRYYGSLTGDPFEPETSPNLVVVAQAA